GPLTPRVHVLGGLGGRGFTLAPLLAEHVVARLLGAPSPLPQALQALVDPGRRAARNQAAPTAIEASTPLDQEPR
ncbi:MAG TPA: hypothetical protein VGB49_07335, partial [Caulobacteraceae bacterium]